MSRSDSFAEAAAPAAPAALAESVEARIFFDVQLKPHRSLSPRGFLLVMTLLASMSFVSGIVFVLEGAWPVFGFFGLDVLLVYIAFRANYRSARHSERVALTMDALIVERVNIYGKSSAITFEPTWLRVEMDDPPAHDSPLVLASHGRRLAIAGFLSPEERAELAAGLREGLRLRRAALVEHA
jgi:uncharacterized membrane protein